jgi:hypothetical protein
MGRDERANQNPVKQVLGSLSRSELYDMVGRPVRERASVYVTTPPTHDLWHVAEIKPHLSPDAPPNHVLVTLQMQKQVLLPLGVPIADVILVLPPPKQPEGVDTGDAAGRPSGQIPEA